MLIGEGDAHKLKIAYEYHYECNEETVILKPQDHREYPIMVKGTRDLDLMT